jgi:hypothetical protein
MDLESLAKLAEPYDKAWAKSRGAQLQVAPDELTEFEAWLSELKPEAKQRSSFAKTRIRGPGNPLGRLIERLNSHHDHGLYTTATEELLIAVGVADKVGHPIWARMKSDIDDAFVEGPHAWRLSDRRPDGGEHVRRA